MIHILAQNDDSIIIAHYNVRTYDVKITCMFNETTINTTFTDPDLQYIVAFLAEMKTTYAIITYNYKELMEIIDRVRIKTHQQCPDLSCLY